MPNSTRRLAFSITISADLHVPTRRFVEGRADDFRAVGPLTDPLHFRHFFRTLVDQ